MAAYATPDASSNMPAHQEAGQAPLLSALLFVLALFPIVLFYVLLFRTLTGLPFNDDYRAVLGAVLQALPAKGWHVLGPIFMHRHNEYLLIFQNAIYVLQYKLLGTLKFKFLTVIGDLLVVPLFGTLWLLWRDFDLPRRYGLLAFVPVSWLLFELQYASTLNCVMAPLQNVAVLVFTLAAFHFGTRTGKQNFLWALLFVALSLSASGGGLFVGPVLGLRYLQQRAWKRFGITFIFSVLIGVAYLHATRVAGVQRGGFGQVYHSFSLAYSAAFLGSIAAGSKPLPAILFAVCLLGLFVYATRDRLDLRNPGLYYATLFFFIQAIALSSFRSGRGLETALGSRYRINSVIVVILLYFFLAEKFRRATLSRPRRVAGALFMGVVLLGFNLASDKAGYHLLQLRRALVQEGIVRWENHESVSASMSASTPEYIRKNEESGMYEPIEPYLSDAIRAGIYVLPPAGPSQ